MKNIMQRPFKNSSSRIANQPDGATYAKGTSHDYRHAKDLPITAKTVLDVIKDNEAISTSMQVALELVSLPTSRHLRRVERFVGMARHAETTGAAS